MVVVNNDKTGFCLIAFNKLGYSTVFTPFRRHQYYNIYRQHEIGVLRVQYMDIKHLILFNRNKDKVDLRGRAV